MRHQARQQFILDLEPESRRATDPAPEALLEALADLLLEAFGEDVPQKASTQGIVDESEDHD